MKIQPCQSGIYYERGYYERIKTFRIEGAEKTEKENRQGYLSVRNADTDGPGTEFGIVGGF